MKKLLLSFVVLASLQAAEHDLYSTSVGLRTGYLFSGELGDGVSTGGYIQKNLPDQSLDQSFFPNAFRISFDRTFDDSSLLGVEAIRYFDNDSPWTPYAGVGAGIQFSGEGDGAALTLLGGLEYQVRGDLSVGSELRYQHDNHGRDGALITGGVRYSFGAW